MSEKPRKKASSKPRQKSTVLYEGQVNNMVFRTTVRARKPGDTMVTPAEGGNSIPHGLLGMGDDHVSAEALLEALYRHQQGQAQSPLPHSPSRRLSTKLALPEPQPDVIDAEIVPSGSSPAVKPRWSIRENVSTSEFQGSHVGENDIRVEWEFREGPYAYMLVVCDPRYLTFDPRNRESRPLLIEDGIRHNARIIPLRSIRNIQHFAGKHVRILVYRYRTDLETDEEFVGGYNYLVPNLKQLAAPEPQVPVRRQTSFGRLIAGFVGLVIAGAVILTLRKFGIFSH